ncbi:MAG: hypothetical protein JRC86_04535 [Deltaproteobacteria bacterium]|nr:hypothetical protein [Deltaproteobacteria bacterium]
MKNCRNDYDKLYKPSEREGFPLEKVIEWLETGIGASPRIVDQVVSGTMLLVAQGEKFEVLDEYKDYPDMAICHYMEAQARILMSRIEESKVKILQEAENNRLEARQRLLSNFDKEYNKVLNGTFGQKLRKFVGLPYTHWENE